MVKNLPAVERSTKIRFGKNVPEATDQAENTIVFNASNVSFDVSNPGAVYLSPIRLREDYDDPQIVLLMYNKETKEITESGEAATDIIQPSLESATRFGNVITVNTVEFNNAFTSFVTASNVGIVNTFAAHTLSVGSNLYIDDTGSNVLVVSGNVAVLRDMVIDGNLRVNGDTTVIYTENTSIKDAFIELGRDNTSGDTTLDLGVLMHRPAALSNVVVGYREGTDEFAIAYTEAKPTDKTFVPKTDEDINVHVYGLTHVDANIYAHEDVLVSGNVYVSQNVSVTEELTVSGNVYADKDLEVIGNTYVDGNVVAYKDLLVSGNVYVSQNVSVTEELTVSGNVYADKDLEVIGNTYVDGNVVAYKDLLVSGNVYVSQNVSVTEELTVSGNVYADKDLEVVGNTYVSGNVVAYKDLLVTGNVYVSQNVSVTEELTVSGNVYADKDLEVIGNTYVDGNVVAYKDLLVTGNVYVSQNVSVTEELTVSGNVYADKDLEVVGNTYVSGNVVAYKDLLVSGNVYVSQNVSVTEELTVSGNVYADKDLEVIGNTYVDGNVVAYKDLTLSGNAYVSGNVNVTKQLSVSGNTYVSGNVEVTKALIVSANTHLKGDNVFVTHTMDFLDPKTAIVTDQVSNVQIRLGQLENVSNAASNPLDDQVLMYEGGEWTNNYPNHSFLTIKNDSLSTMVAGNAVYVSGYQNSNLAKVKLAKADSPTTMPSIGIVYSTSIAPGEEGLAAAYGKVNQINTNGYNVGETLYVSNLYAGWISNVKPYYTDSVPNLIQNIGVVTRKDTSHGAMFVTGIGRANDIPNARIITDYNDMQYVYVNSENNDLKKITSANLNIPLTTAVSSSSNSAANAVTLRGVSITSGDGFHGDLVVAGNVTVDTNTLKVDAEANRVGILTASPGQTLDVRGSISTDDYLIHNGDTNTKIGFSGDDTFVVNTNGTEQLKIDTNGNTYVTSNLSVDTNTLHIDSVSNRVGILTTAPGQALDVRGAANVGALSATSASVTGLTHSTSKDTGILVLTQGGLGVEANIHSTNVFAASHIAVGTSDTSNTFDVRGTANVGALVATSTHISDSTTSTSTTSGALQVRGGVSTQENLNVGGVTKVWDTTAASNKTSGALQVLGGVGIDKDLYATDGHFTTDVSVGSLTNKYIPYANASKILTDSQISQEADGTVVISNDVEITGTLLVSGDSFEVSAGELVVQDRIIDIANNNPDHALDIGILLEHPGHNIGIIHHGTDELTIGYTQNGYSDTHILQDYSNHITMNVWGHVITQNTVTVEYNDVYIVGGGLGIGIGDRGDGKPHANIHVVGNVHVTSNISTTGNVIIDDSTSTTSKTTGALQVTGGVGVQGDIYATNVTGTDTVKGATLTGTSVYGTISGSNTAAVSDLTASGTVKGATLTGTSVYGTIEGSNTAAVSDLTASGTVKGGTLTGTSVYGTLSGSNTAAVSDLTASGTVKGGTLTGTSVYGTIEGSNTAAVSDLTASGTVKGGTLTGTSVYGTIEGSNTAAVSDLTASGTVKGGTLTGTSVYGTIEGSNTAAVSDLTASGTVKGATLTGTSVYGTIEGSNTAAVSDLTASGTVKGATLTGMSVYGTISGSNTASVSTLTVSGTTQATDTLTGALTVAGGISTQTNVHAANVYISGGLITNTAGVTKKTYAYSGDLANGTTIANATIKITFSAHVFYAKIVAHLVESDSEVSTLSLECGGGNWSGGTPLAIAKGPQAIFGSTSTNPWDSATTTTTTEVSFKPTTAMAADGHYNVFIEYISQSSAGKVSKVTVGTTDVVTFTY
jgi:cytoskeletal protein CcmA (bactofilin family)